MLGEHINMRTPDAIEPEIGWRTWKVVDNYGRMMLRSPSIATLWVPGQVLYAMCTHTPAEREEGCQCGVNSFASEELMADADGYLDADVWGEVSLWGETHEFETGIRAQYAYPKCLHVQPHIENAEAVAEQLSREYNVPCDVAQHPGHSAEALGRRMERNKDWVFGSTGSSTSIKIKKAAWDIDKEGVPRLLESMIQPAFFAIPVVSTVITVAYAYIDYAHVPLLVAVLPWIAAFVFIASSNSRWGERLWSTEGSKSMANWVVASAAFAVAGLMITMPALLVALISAVPA